MRSLNADKKLKYKLISYFDPKQCLTIAATFVITFVFSIALSQGLASQRQIQVLGATTMVQPIAIRAGIVAPQTQPDSEIYLPRGDVMLPDNSADRKLFLKSYLQSKHSDLAKYVNQLSDQTQWKLIVAIAEAESNSCTKLPKSTHNCWGIGGAWNLKHYRNYSQAIADVNRIIETYYVSQGLDTPEEIVNKWVGHDNPDWAATVQKELNNLNAVN